jgi:hypothetical protein
MKKEKEKLLLGATASSCVLNQQLFQNQKEFTGAHGRTRWKGLPVLCLVCTPNLLMV